MRGFFAKVASAASVAAIGLTSIISAQASDFPNRPITLIVPFQAGVSADILFRGLADLAAKELGQPVIVDNRPGGSSTLGPVQMASNSKPDGYTISQLAIPAYRVPLMQKVSWDPVRDFTYIIQLGGYTLGAVVKSDSPFKKWQDVLDYAKDNPGKFTYATIGPQTTNAIATELMAKQSGVKLTHVPTKGGGESIAAVMGGHINMMVESPAWAPLVASGDFRALFVLTSERSPKWPDVPTMKDLGYPFAFDSPFGLVGPKGMPPDVVKKLHDAFKKAYDHPSAPAMFDKFDFTRRYLSTEEYAAAGPKYAAQEREGLERVGLIKK